MQCCVCGGKSVRSSSSLLPDKTYQSATACWRRHAFLLLVIHSLAITDGWAFLPPSFLRSWKSGCRCWQLCFDWMLSGALVISCWTPPSSAPITLGTQPEKLRPLSSNHPILHEQTGSTLVSCRGWSLTTIGYVSEEHVENRQVELYSENSGSCLYFIPSELNGSIHLLGS